MVQVGLSSDGRHATVAYTCEPLFVRQHLVRAPSGTRRKEPARAANFTPKSNRSPPIGLRVVLAKGTEHSVTRIRPGSMPDSADYRSGHRGNTIKARLKPVAMSWAPTGRCAPQPRRASASRSGSRAELVAPSAQEGSTCAGKLLFALSSPGNGHGRDRPHPRKT